MAINDTTLQALLDLGQDAFTAAISVTATPLLQADTILATLAMERNGLNRTTYVQALCFRLGVTSPRDVIPGGAPFTNGGRIPLPSASNPSLQGSIQSTSGNKIALMGHSVTLQNFPKTNVSDTGWDYSQVITLNSYVAPKYVDLTNGYAPLRFKCTTPGTTSADYEPTWPNVVGGTVTDGTVVWTAEYTSATIVGWNPGGWWTIAQALSGQRFDEVFMTGNSGKSSPDILKYMNRVLAANPDTVFFADMFENDVVNTPVFATVTANWNAFVLVADAVRALGKRVIIQTLSPSGSIDASAAFTSYVSGNGTKSWAWLNQQIRAYARARRDVVLFELDKLYIDPNVANPVWPENATTFLSATGTGQQLKYTDGIHTNMAATWKRGVALAVVLTANFPAVARFGSPAEANQRHTNPLNYGTAGTRGTNVGSGNVANLVTLNAAGTSGTVTGVASQTVRTDIAGNWQNCVYNASAGVADGPSHGLTSAPALAPNAVGDVMQAFVECKVTANPTLLQGITGQLRFQGSTSGPQWAYSIWWTSTDQDLGQFITADTVLTLKTVPMAISPGTTNLNLFLKSTGRGAAVFTTACGQSALGKVSIPALV